MIFQTKKVPLETLGEYLTEIRQQLGLSVAEVVDQTGIGERYLLNLESGQYDHLPPDVYVLGFLRKLAYLYDVSLETLLSQYKKERGIVDQVAQQVLLPQKGWRSWLSRLVITPKLLTLAGGTSLVLIALLYLVIQVLAINRTPDLKILEPSADSVVKESTINVRGHTDAGSLVSINGQSVFVDSKGDFQTTLSAVAGQKELVVMSQNKFGKQASQKLLVLVENPTPVATSVSTPSSTTSKLNLELKFTRPATIDINRDGVDLAAETIPADSIKTIEADNQIILKTSDAGSIIATLNGKQLGTLGRAREPLTIPFTVESIP